MSTLAEERIKLVGDILPYVFIESVAIYPIDSLRAEDYMAIKDTVPVFEKNEFNNNKLVVSSSLEDPDQSSAFRASITISMNDLLKNSTWYNTPVRNLMSVKIFYATSRDAFNVIRSPFFRSIDQAPQRLRNHIGEKIVKIPINKDLAYYKTRQVDNFDDILCTIKIKETFRVKANYLAFAAFPYVEAPSLHGVRAIQNVMKDGRLDARSTTYYNPDGTIWSGPVNIHPEKGVMAGKSHSRVRHDILEAVEHENLIKDYRIFDKFKSLHGTIDLGRQNTEHKSVFSDLMLTGDPAGNVRGLFVFYMVGLLRQKSQFNSLITKRNTKKIMRLSNIRRIRVLRTRINNFESGETAESSIIGKTKPKVDVLAEFNDEPGKSIRINRVLNVVDKFNDKVPVKEVGSLSEVAIAGIGNKRAFSFVDLEMPSINNGTYVYSLEIDVKDPTIRLLETQIVGLKQARQVLSTYYKEANGRGNYNSKTGELSYDYLQKLKTINNLNIKTKGKKLKSVSLPWRIAPKMYFDVLETLLSRNIPVRDKKSLQKLLYPSTKNLAGVEKFLSLIDSLLKGLEKYNVIRKQNLSKSAGGRGLDSKTHIIQMQKGYLNKPWRVTRYNNSPYRLDYFGGAMARTKYGLSRINRNSLVSRFDMEASKLFPEITEDESRQSTSPALQNYRKVYFSSLSPVALLSKDKQIILSEGGKQSYAEAKRLLRMLELGQNLNTQMSEHEILQNLGASVSKRGKQRAPREQVIVDKYLGESTNLNTKVSNKDSQRDQGPVAHTQDIRSNEIRDALLGKKAAIEKIRGPISTKDSLVKRYIKQQSQANARGLLDDELSVLEQTEVSVKYIIVFDNNMAPIYAKTIPHSAQPSIYVLDLEKDMLVDMGELELISDSVGLIYSSGGAVSAQQAGQRNNQTVQDAPEATPAQIPTQDPCPVGYRYNDSTESCVLREGRASVRQLDALDSPIHDTEPALGQSQPMAREATQASQASSAPSVTTGANLTGGTTTVVGGGGGGY